MQIFFFTKFKFFLLIFAFFPFLIFSQAPSEPTILTPVVDSPTAILWRWQDNSINEDYFKLYFLKGDVQGIFSPPKNSNSFKTENLTPNTQYQVKVCAVNESGESCSSPSQIAVTLANPPSNLKGKVSSDAISISWEPNLNSPETEYFIENLETKKNSGWQKGLFWFVMKDLECGKKYNFLVKARNLEKIETQPVEISLSTLPCPITIGISTSTPIIKISLPPLVFSFVQTTKETFYQFVTNPREAIKNISQIPERIRKNPTIIELQKNKRLKTAIRVGESIGLGIGILGGISGILPQARSLRDFLFLPLRLVAIFTGFRKKYWGVVYDAITKQPLDPALVILKDKEGKEIQSQITDLYGRYGFLTETGEYYIEAAKTNYKFPSQRIKGKEDEIYTNLYHGELLKIEKPEVITVDIPLDPVGFDWNEMAKKAYIKFNYFGELAKRYLSEFIFLFGFFLSLFAWISQPSTINQVVVLTYFFVILLRFFGFKPRNWGFVLDKKNKKPIPFAVLRLFFENLPHEIKTIYADEKGRYYSICEKGTYDIIVEERDLKSQERKFRALKKGIRVKKGVLNKDILV